MTENSDPKLSEVARHIVMPSGIVTQHVPQGQQARPKHAASATRTRWQQGLLTLILGRRADGTFAASVGGVVLSILPPDRQDLHRLHLVVILCTLIPNLTVIWTAHHNVPNSNTFDHVRTLVRNPRAHRIPRPLRPAPTACAAGNGMQEITFSFGNAARYCSAHEPRASPEATTP